MNSKDNDSMKNQRNKTTKWYELKSCDILENYLNRKNTSKITGKYTDRYSYFRNKIQIQQGFMNICILSVLFRWLDIPVIVKKGGIKFGIIAFGSLYFSNKYFYLYSLFSRLEAQSKYEKCETVDIMINKIIQIHLDETKDERTRAKALSKYWNEPMAWH